MIFINWCYVICARVCVSVCLCFNRNLLFPLPSLRRWRHKSPLKSRFQHLDSSRCWTVLFRSGTWTGLPADSVWGKPCLPAHHGINGTCRYPPDPLTAPSSEGCCFHSRVGVRVVVRCLLWEDTGVWPRQIWVGSQPAYSKILTLIITISSSSSHRSSKEGDITIISARAKESRPRYTM